MQHTPNTSPQPDQKAARRRAEIERLLHSLSRPRSKWLKWFHPDAMDRGGMESRLAELLEEESDWPGASNHWVSAMAHYQSAMHERHKHPDEVTWFRNKTLKCYENVLRTAAKCPIPAQLACYERLTAIIDDDELRTKSLSNLAGARITYAEGTRERARKNFCQPAWEALYESNEKEAKRQLEEAIAVEVEKTRLQLLQLAADDNLPLEIRARAHFKWGQIACLEWNFVEGFRAFVAATDMRGCPFSRMVDPNAIFIAPSFAQWFKDLAGEVPTRLSAADALWMMRRLAGPNIGEFVASTLVDCVDDAGRDFFEGIAITYIAQDDIIAARLIALYAVQTYSLIFDARALTEHRIASRAGEAAKLGKTPAPVEEIKFSDFWQELLPQIRELASADTGPTDFSVEALFAFPNTPSRVWANCVEAWKAARLGRFRQAEELYQEAIDLAIKAADPVSMPAQLSWIAEHAGLAGVVSVVGYAAVRVEKSINSLKDCKTRAAWLNRYCDLCMWESLRPTFQRFHASFEAMFSKLGNLSAEFNDGDAATALSGLQDVRARSSRPLTSPRRLDTWYGAIVQAPVSLRKFQESQRVPAPARANEKQDGVKLADLP